MQVRQGTLAAWVQAVFGAQNVSNVSTDVGTLLKAYGDRVFFDNHTMQGLAAQLRLAEQSLLLLVQRLDELLFNLLTAAFNPPNIPARSARPLHSAALR